MPWKEGRCVAWDVMVTDTMAQSYLPVTSQTSGAAAEAAGGQEDSQVCPIDAGIFVHGDCSWNHGSHQQRRYRISGRPIGRRITQDTDDNHEKAFLYQRSSLMIQRYNTVAILGSVLRPRQHSTGYMGDSFYRSKDPTNSIKVLKVHTVHREIKHTIIRHEHKTQQVPFFFLFFCGMHH